MVAIDFRLYADWNQDGDFSDASEDITEYAMTITWRLGMSQLWQSVADESTLQAQLTNADGRFNPENASSPLAGLILPQVPILLTADGNTIWRGFLDFIDSQWQPGGASHGALPVMLYAVGVKQRLEKAELSIPLQQNKRGDEIIADLLSRVSLPPAVSSQQMWLLGMPGYSELEVSTVLGDASQFSELETGEYIFFIYGNERAKNAYEMFTEITEAERGKGFIARDGRMYWWNQNHLLDYAPVTETVDDTGTLGPKPTEVDYRFGQDISNSISVTFTPRKIDTSTITLWTLDTPIELLAGERQRIECLFVDEDGLPVGAQDTSLDLANVTWESNPGVLRDATVTIDTRLGDRAYLLLDNVAEELLPATLATLEITGKKVAARNSMTVREQDTDSLERYGKRQLDFKLAMDNPVDAVNTAQLEVIRRKDAQGIVRFVGFLNANDGVQNEHHLGWEIGTRLRVKLHDNFGHDAEYMIMGEQHTIGAGQKDHQTLFYLEPLNLKRLTYYGRVNTDVDAPLDQASDIPKIKLCQLFTVPYSHDCTRVRLWLRRVGNPSGQVTVKLYDTSQLDGWELGVGTLEVDSVLGQATEEPDTLLATSNSREEALLEEGYRWVEFVFGTPAALTAGVTYAIVLESSVSHDADHYVAWGADESAPTYADGELLAWEDSIYWDLEYKVASFEVYG